MLESASKKVLSIFLIANILHSRRINTKIAVKTKNRLLTLMNLNPFPPYALCLQIADYQVFLIYMLCIYTQSQVMYSTSDR